MTKYHCYNVSSEANHYSDPVPFIGLYTALASMVCWLLMLSDLIYGVFSKKNWLPCRYFRLNSVTLALLTVAAKIPLDLTTSMPSQTDQFAKLSGVVMICGSMVFFVPSVGDNRDSECWTNIGALSIFVVTVVVDISIQMYTGLIFEFFAAHIISMVLMLLTLLHLWVSTWDINFKKEVSMDINKDIFKKGGGSMLQGLKLCYLHGFKSNPQLVSFKHQTFIHLVSFYFLGLTLVSFFTSISKRPSFFDTCSDYGWSMTIIIATQVSSLIIVSIAVFMRTVHAAGLGFRFREWRSYLSLLDQPLVTVITRNDPFLRFNGVDAFDVVLLTVAYLWTFLVSPFTFLPFIVITVLKGSVSVKQTWGFVKDHGSSFLHLIQLLPSVISSRIRDLLMRIRDDFRSPSTEYHGIEEIKDLLSEYNMEMKETILENCVRDINRWMTVRSDPLSHLNELLSTTSLSQSSIEQLNIQYGWEEGREVSCLYLVFLERIASVSAPTLSGCLTQSLGEVFDIVHFVDTKMNSLRLKNKKKCILAKAMWAGTDFCVVLPKIFMGPMDDARQPQTELDCALQIIRELKTENLLPSDFIWEEVDIIMDLINAQTYTSIQELYGYIEKLFVDMLHIFLIQLPLAIFKEVTESRVEEYEGRVSEMLKLLWKVRSLEDKVQWSFPVGTNITSLITAQPSIGDNN